MSQIPNQFAQNAELGDMDLQNGASNVISGLVHSTESATLTGGQALKMADASTKIPTFLKCTADDDDVFGFLVSNFKKGGPVANDAIEVALAGSVMFMVAGAAIARNAKLEVDVSTDKVITNAGTNPVIGRALDKAAADGDLIRVLIQTPLASIAQTIADVGGLTAALQEANKTVVNTATIAEINAGKTLVAVAAGKKAIVTDFIVRANGNFTELTTLNLKVGAAVVATFAAAQLQNGDIVFAGETGVTLGAAFGIAGGDGDDIVIDKTGTNEATATDATLTVTYNIVDA